MTFPDDNRRTEEVRTEVNRRPEEVRTDVYVQRDDRGFRWWDPTNMVLAIWLFISPWVLQFGSNAPVALPATGARAVAVVNAAAWDAWVLGVIVFLVALSAMGKLARGQEWINLLLGIWLFIAPWVLGFSYGPYGWAAWDHWAVGALVFIVSAIALWQIRSERHRREQVVRTDTVRTDNREPFRR